MWMVARTPVSGEPEGADSLPSLEFLSVMDTAVHNFVAQGLVRTLGRLIIDDGIRSHFDAPVAACPVLRFGQQLPTYSAVAVILGHKPTLDVAHWL